MPRRNRPETDTELNLAPIMNMVVILIPLLLLSVVFLKVGVVNVSTPKLAPGPSSESPPDEGLGLTVMVDEAGLTIAGREGVLRPLPGCPEPGPTVCAREIAAVDDPEAAAAAHDWRALYNELAALKAAHPHETTVTIKAADDVPYAVIVRLMDVARFRLARDAYTDDAEFWTASYRDGGTGHAELFPDPVLAL